MLATPPWKTWVACSDPVLDDTKDALAVVLTLRFQVEAGATEPYVRPFMDSLMRNEAIRSIISSINAGFHLGLVPQENKFGVSGNYFLRGPDKMNLVFLVDSQAIFKPFDEEPYAPNNPKGYIGKFGTKAMRDGILSGEGATREVAAFMLDSHRVHQVPETFFAELYHPYFERQSSNADTDSQEVEKILPMCPEGPKTGVKYGSLQFLKDNDGESSDFSCRRFSVEEIQSIAVLDFRILNCDRNEGNILVKQIGKETYNLIPIDHALSLPDNLSICDYELCWSLWPQIEQPINEKLYHYIVNLDTKANAQLLKKHLKLRPVDRR